jgi:hypothetical protein
VIEVLVGVRALDNSGSAASAKSMTPMIIKLRDL